MATLQQVCASGTDKLLEAKLLVATGHVPVVAAMDDYEDEPIPADLVARAAGSTAITTATAAGSKSKSGDRGRAGRLSAGIRQDAGGVRARRAIAPGAFDRRSRLGRRNHQADGREVAGAGLVCAAACATPAVWAQLEALLVRRPPEEVRVILTSTPGDRIPITTHKRNIIIERGGRARRTGQARDLAAGPGCAGLSGSASAPVPDRPFGGLRDRLASWQEYRSAGQKHRQILSDCFSMLIGPVDPSCVLPRSCKAETTCIATPR